MNSKSQLMELTLLVSADHIFIHQCLDSYRTLQSDASPTEKNAAVEQIKHVIGKKLLEHFALEDQRVFPAFEAAYPTGNIPQIIAKLREEHDTMRGLMQPLIEMLSTPNSDPLANQNINRALIGFFIKFREHAVREDDLFAELSEMPDVTTAS